MPDYSNIDDPEIKKAGKTPGLQIWRIEDFKLKPIPKNQYGSFYDGDAYIVMNTTTTKSGRNKNWDIHFWLGKNSTNDEQGTAAMLTVAIDESLGGDPVQYREVQTNESSKFKSYFKAGLIYKTGGVASGFKHVKTNDFSDIQRLLHVKGKRNVCAHEVPVKWDSFNQGDSFILDLGHQIIVYNAPEANRAERRKANALARDIRDRERAGRARVEIIEDSHSRVREDYPELIAEMEKVIGVPKPARFASATKDEVVGAAENQKSKLFHLSDATGEVVVKEVAVSPFQQSILIHDDVYIVDQGAGNTIFVWKGKGATKNERSSAMSYAMQYMTMREYPKTTKIEVMGDGSESTMFKQLFKTWKPKNQGTGKVYTVGKVAKQQNTKFDASTLHSNPVKAATSRMPDDGQGKKKIWRIEASKMVELPMQMYGQFFTGDSYLVLYTYEKHGREAHIVYLWQGAKSPADERAACAFLAVAIDDHFGGEPVQVRVEQGHEPRHFLEIFKGCLVIHQGGYDSQNKTEATAKAKRLYHVKGSNSYNTKAVEVDCSASRLNSGDCFFLRSPRQNYIWCGRGSNGDERDMAKALAAKLVKNSF